MRAFHFVNATLRGGQPIPADGVWLEHTGEIEMCVSGLHASKEPFDALQYAPGNTLCLVEVDNDIRGGDDKLVCRRRKIVKRIDAEPLMREFARWCALQAIEYWEAPDVVRRYLESGDESLRDAAGDAAWAAAWAAGAAAGDAAWAAAWAAGAAAGDAAWAARDAAGAAAGDAAGAAARDAAWAAAWARQRERFNKMVYAAFDIEQAVSSPTTKEE